MFRKLFAALFGLGLAVSLIPQVLRAEEDHITEAILHTKQALIHGRNGHADLVSEHAKVALSHARAADIAKGNPHTSDAVKELEQTIDESKMNHAVMATGHAEAALIRLSRNGGVLGFMALGRCRWARSQSYQNVSRETLWYD